MIITLAYGVVITQHARIPTFIIHISRYFSSKWEYKIFIDNRSFPSIIYLFNTGCHIQILPNICKPIIKFFLSIAFFHFKPPVKINLFAGKVCRPILGGCGTKYTACSRKFKAGALYDMFTIEILTAEPNSKKIHA